MSEHDFHLTPDHVPAGPVHLHVPRLLYSYSSSSQLNLQASHHSKGNQCSKLINRDEQLNKVRVVQLLSQC